MKLWKLRKEEAKDGLPLKRSCEHGSIHMMWVDSTWVHWCTHCGALKIQPSNAKYGWARHEPWRIPQNQQRAD